MKVRLGSRGSRLALVQVELARAAIAAARPDVGVELVVVKTEGDRNREARIQDLGTGAFTKELEDALLEGRCDLAVHSLKDLPTTLAPGLALAATLPRADPRDAVCARGGGGLADLPRGARVGTSSPRRAGQLLALRPDLALEALRGNVETRLSRIGLPREDPRALDAVVLAMAGLDRLGRSAGVARPIDLDAVLPAPGQAAVALESRAGDAPTLAVAASIDDRRTRLATETERLLHQALGGGCRAPVGALARIEGDRISLSACVTALDGSRLLKASGEGRTAAGVAGEVAAKLRALGADPILAAARGG